MGFINDLMSLSAITVIRITDHTDGLPSDIKAAVRYCGRENPILADLLIKSEDRPKTTFYIKYTDGRSEEKTVDDNSYIYGRLMKVYRMLNGDRAYRRAKENKLRYDEPKPNDIYNNFNSTGRHSSAYDDSDEGDIDHEYLNH